MFCHSYYLFSFIIFRFSLLGYLRRYTTTVIWSGDRGSKPRRGRIFFSVCTSVLKKIVWFPFPGPYARGKFNGAFAGLTVLSHTLKEYLHLYSLLGCSHRRAPEYYISSVQKKDWWKAFPCEKLCGKCKDCKGKCTSMGYEADLDKKTGKYYLKTNKKAPFRSTLIF